MAGELRITGGALARRRITVPPAADRGTLRPTSDKVRAALMSALGARLEGARVLDAFAGSGALGIEALSRGALHATFVERDRRSATVLSDNIHTLGLEARAEVVIDDVKRALLRLPAGAFDVVLADPPYALGVDDLMPQLARAASGDGVLVIERDRRARDATPDGWQVLRDRLYGDTRVLMYCRTGGSDAYATPDVPDADP